MTLDEVISRLSREPARTGLFLDFDGTLAPIVDDPRRSRMPEVVQPLVEGCAAHLALVAVVSGRPAAFLADRVTATEVRRFGLYGLEEWVDGATVPRPEAASWREAVEQAREVLVSDLADAEGVHVEDKGLGVAVHWRNAPDHDSAHEQVSALVESLADRIGLAQEPGKLVLELRPPVEWDKGSCVRALSAELELAELAYVGDDLGDLPAFAAARSLGGLALAVDHGAETPQQVRAAADLVLDGTQAVTAFLEQLSAALEGEC